MFLLPASRGDIDISTDDLMVLVEVPPIYLIVQYEYHREHCNCLKTSSEVRKYFGENVSVQESCPLMSFHPARECSNAFHKTFLLTLLLVRTLLLFSVMV